MIKMIEGVRVDSEVSPCSYDLIDKAVGLAKHFKQSVQDALQELMYLELISKEKNISDVRGYIIASFYRNTVSRVRNDIYKRKHVESVVSQGYFTSEEHKVIQDRIFVNELVSILKEIDEVLAGIMITVRENLDMSLWQIYRCYYADDFSKQKFYARIKELRQIITDFSQADQRSCLYVRGESVAK